jgi:hypothetical protein
VKSWRSATGCYNTIQQVFSDCSNSEVQIRIGFSISWMVYHSRISRFILKESLRKSALIFCKVMKPLPSILDYFVCRRSGKLLLTLASSVILVPSPAGVMAIFYWLLWDSCNSLWLSIDWMTSKLLLALASTVILGSESHRTHGRIVLFEGSDSLHSSCVNSRLLYGFWYGMFSC